MGRIKEQMLNDFNNANIQKGDLVKVPAHLFYAYEDKDKIITLKFVEYCDNGKAIVINDSGCKKVIDLTSIERDTTNVGVNPMSEHNWRDGMCVCEYTTQWVHSMRNETFTLEDGVKIKGFNFDPYITDKNGEKVYYQRKLCWTLENKQNFIESIYNELNCGTIIVKYNSDEKMLETHGEYDVVDGKQRLHTLIEFFNDEFPDKNGYYWSDFSKRAQRQFLQTKCMTFYEFGVNTTDEKIKKAFLNVNFTGVPMSNYHIEYIKAINI